MRSAPAAQFRLVPEREPRFAAAALCASAFAASTHWLDAWLNWEMVWLPVVVAVSSFAVVTLCGRQRAVHAHWDTQCWRLQLERFPNGGADSLVGEIHVVVDLGPAMVLRFRESHTGSKFVWRRMRWFTVQRSSLQPQWQVFRRAVYSPRPMVDRPDASFEEAAF